MKTSAPSIRAVAFDLDGLMFNTETLYEEVGAELLRRRGKSITRPLLDQMMGRPSPIALQIMIDWHRLDLTVEQLEEETDQIFGQLLQQRLAPMPGLIRLLDSLESAEVPKAITTSSRRTYVDRVLSLMDMKNRFQFVLTAEDVIHGKPHPEIYLTAARRFALPAREVMVLEDSENGCLAAASAGTFAVAVPGEHSRQHDFSGAIFVADTLADDRIYRAIGIA
jgi:HAD superfamily hydrolase (TIGR01509 family)